LNRYTYLIQLKKLGSNAFNSCESLKVLDLAEVTTVGTGAFAYCYDLEALIIPDTVTSIGANALRQSAPIVYIGQSKAQTNSWTNWLSNYAGDPNDIIYDHDDIVYTAIKRSGSTVAYSVRSATNVKDPSKTLFIDYHEGLEVREIQKSAFKNCVLNALAVGTDPNSTHEITVCDAAFAQSKINSVAFGNNVVFESELEGTFLRSAVHEVILPDTLEEILPYMFSECRSLERISFVSALQDNVLSANITKIGAGAFLRCEELSYLYIPANVTTIEYEAFNDWTDLQTIEVDNYEYELDLDNEWDAECEAIIIFKIDLTYELLANNTYKVVSIDGNSRHVRYVAIPSEYNSLPVTVLGAELFYICHDIVAVVVPDSVTNIEHHAFADCINLRKISLPSVTTIDDSAFKHCYTLTSVYIPVVVTIGYGAFCDCYALTEIELPASLVTISYAFFGSDSFTTAYIGRSATNPAEVIANYGPNLFAECPIAYIYVPDDGISLDAYKAAWPIYAHLIFVTP